MRHCLRIHETVRSLVFARTSPLPPAVIPQSFIARRPFLSPHRYVFAQTIVQVLKRCGDELIRENIMIQAANLKGFELGLLLPQPVGSPGGLANRRVQ